MRRSAAATSVGLASAALVTLTGLGCREQAREVELRFREVAVASGLDYRGPTYAVAAADVDGDGWSDLAVSQHGSVRLYRNLGDGGFADVTGPDLARFGDTHGVSWLDLDDDGMWDLFVSIGAARGRGVGANRAYLNRGGVLAEAPRLDPVLEHPLGRGRCGCPVDVDQDGRVDLALMNAYQPDRGQRLAVREEAGWRDIATEAGWRDIAWECPVVIHLDGSEDPVYLAGVASARQPRGYRYDRAVGSFSDVTEEIGLTVAEPVSAMVPGDYDNDGDLDLYVVTGGGVPEGVEVVDGGLMFRLISLPEGRLKGFRFRSAGPLTASILLEGREDPARVLLGRDRVPLADAGWNGDPSSPLLAGRPEVDPAHDRGVFLWRDDDGALALRFAGDPSELWETSGRIESATEIRVLDRLGLIGGGGGPRSHLLENRAGRLEEVTDRVGIAGAGSAVDAAFADVDNDGDLDLFVVTGREPFSNLPDVLYRNNGDGTFTDVTLAAGLSSSVPGRGDGVVAWDYDRDGDLDLLTTNGRGPPPGNAGPHQLWRNDSAGGSSAVVDVVGPAGNRPAFGTRLTVRVGDRRLGLERFASSGRFATSILPFHIGLAGEDRASVTVRWPSGAEWSVDVRAGEELTLRLDDGPPGAGSPDS